MPERKKGKPSRAAKDNDVRAKTVRAKKGAGSASRKPAAPPARGTWLVEIAPATGTADPEGARLLREARVLGLHASGARSAIVYELPGVDERGARELAEKLLRDPILERATVTGPADALSKKGGAQPARGERTATCVRKTGVMDPVALSTLAAARDVGVALEDVRTARRVYVTGGLDEGELSRLAVKVLGNDVLDEVVLGEAPLPHHERAARSRSPASRKKAPAPVLVPLRELGPEALVALSKARTLALDVHEMKSVQAHYRKLEREPTELELETIAQTWSEHCKHKTLTGPIDLTERLADGTERSTRIGNLLKETIFGATKELALPWCVSVFEDNAGVIELDATTGIAVKVETHNHPSAIEPYGGSGTGMGGVIRDILGTGLGARPIASIDVFCIGDLHAKDEDVPPGALHPRALLAGVVAGVRDYGNRMGIPTVAGSLISDPRYVGNPLVFCGTIGTIPIDKVAKAARPGDRIVVAGGRTGRDGIHGATFSSDALTSESETLSSGAVQIGNAIEEKKVQEVLLDLRDRGLLRAVTDCGAGGLSSAVGEMARETGATVQLERAPLKYEGLAPWEVWISEAQERMVFAVAPDDVETVIRAFADEDSEATDLGEFRGDGRLVVKWGETVVGDLDQHFLHEGLPKTPRKAEWREPAHQALSVPSQPTAGVALRRLLAHPSICSREWIIRQYDHEVQGASAVKALTGARSDGPSDAVAVCIRGDGETVEAGSRRGIVVGLGCQPRFSDHDPWLGAWASVDEAIRNVVATGGDPERCALLDNFSWGDCRKPDRLGGIVRAARACREAALLHKAPFISGKDSLNNEYVLPDGRAIAIPGTLLVTAISVVADVAALVTMDLKAPGHRLYLLGETRAELGGSYWLEVVGGHGGQAPAPPFEAAGLYRKLHSAMNAGLVRACHDLSEGGLAVALAEMAFAGEIGAKVSLAPVPRSLDAGDDRTLLFSESGGRLLVAVAPEDVLAFETKLAGEAFAPIGETTAAQVLRVTGEDERTLVLDEPLAELKRVWQEPLFDLYDEARAK